MKEVGFFVILVFMLVLVSGCTLQQPVVPQYEGLDGVFIAFLEPEWEEIGCVGQFQQVDRSLKRQIEEWQTREDIVIIAIATRYVGNYLTGAEIHYKKLKEVEK